MSRSENFEESLEDIEAEAEIYSPTKTPTHGDVKQKKKSKDLLTYEMWFKTLMLYLSM